MEQTFTGVGFQRTGRGATMCATIDASIADAKCAADIFQLVDVVSDHFTEEHLIKAIQRLAAVAPMSNTGPKGDIVMSKTLSRMVQTAVHNAQTYRLSDLARIICALGHIGAEMDIQHLDHCAVQLAQELTTAQPNVISTVMWGFAKLSYAPGILVLQKVIEFFSQSLDRFMPLNICEVIFALASMQQHPGREVLQRAMAKIMSANTLSSLMGPLDIALLLWAYVVFNEDPGNEVLVWVTSSMLADKAKWCGSEASILVLWDFANIGFFPGLDALNLVHSGLEPSTCMQKLGTDKVMRLLFSFSKFNYHPGEHFLEKMSQALGQYASLLMGDAVEIVLWTYATFSLSPGQQLLQECGRNVERNARNFSPTQLANLVWAFEMFDACHSNLWSTLVHQLCGYPLHSIPPHALLRIYEVYLYKQYMMPNMARLGFISLWPDLESQCATCWKESMQQRVQQQSGATMALRREVGAMLAVMSVMATEDHVVEDGIFVHDFAIPETKTLLDVIGPESCLRNAMAVAGPAVSRTRLLHAHYKDNTAGWRPVSVNFHEWQLHKTDSERQQYLLRLIAPVAR